MIGIIPFLYENSMFCVLFLDPTPRLRDVKMMHSESIIYSR